MQTGVGVILLLIIWLVVNNLPMLNAIALPLDFTLTDLLGAAILTAIVVILCNFGVRMELRLAYLVKSFPQGGTMLKQLVYLIAVLIVYFAFRPLVVPYLKNYDWIYHLLFLVVFLAYLGILGYSIYNNIEELTAVISGRYIQEKPSVAANIVCGKCGEKNFHDSRFCSFCGAELPRPVKCSSCGTLLEPDAKFCYACGWKVGESAENKAAGDAPEETVSYQTPTCISCKAEIRPGVQFCPFCGTAQKQE
jgi:RNA polymerase subunit RPABC4/transcription elongation factor Spt4